MAESENYNRRMALLNEEKICVFDCTIETAFFEYGIRSNFLMFSASETTSTPNFSRPRHSRKCEAIRKEENPLEWLLGSNPAS
jgi:hypothetical protein